MFYICVVLEKSKYARTVAILLSSLVLFSSFGLTLNMHLCQGKVKTISLLGEAKKCIGMDEGSTCKTDESPVSITKKKCCSDASFKPETSSQNILVVNSQVDYLVLGINPYAKLIPASTPEIDSDINLYTPPPEEHRGRTLLVLHQIFLI